MDSHSILDHDSGDVPVSGGSPKTEPVGNASPPDGKVRFPGEDGGKSLAEMAERDLTATLQLLAERAQYITGASGAAIALRDHEEMVCRASAGSSAPEVGAQLQVNSGLSGESVRTKQTLRCDDATTDERVNRESCEALGIRSVVVMPLLRGDDVIGVFELFSDQANIFETRDLAALERMGGMVHTALEHSAASLGLAPLPAEKATRPPLPVNQHASDRSSHGLAVAGDQPPSHLNPAAIDNALSAIPPSDNGHETASPMDEPQVPATPPSASPGIAFHMKMPARPADPPPPDQAPAPSSLRQEDVVEPMSEEVDILETPIELSPAVAAETFTEVILDPEFETSAPEQVAPILSVAEPRSAELPPRVPEASKPAPARGALANLKRCETCGFPVSEGRRLCLDCEKKSASQTATAKLPSFPSTDAPTAPSVQVTTPAPASAELPNFLGSDEPEASWLATHKFMAVAIVLAVIGIVAAVMLR